MNINPISLAETKVIKTPLMIEQHIHGAFGIDFNNASCDDIIGLTRELFKHGIGGFFPTLVTDTINNIKHQINIIKQATRSAEENAAKILGIHLEGPFLNPEKKGIHNKDWFLPLTTDNYKKFEDDFIKIVTLAPELDEGLISYLISKGIKVQAGHCLATDLTKVDGTTHTFNAMGTFLHKEQNTVSSALSDDRLYSEIIADGVHVHKDTLKTFFKCKPDDKVILVSDALPITLSNQKETEFAGVKIFYNGQKATSVNGILAGSTTLLDGIVKYLAENRLFKTKYIENTYKYHNMTPKGQIIWDNEYNIIEVKM